MQLSHQNIVFDLDGTLTNSAPGIYRSVKWALARMNYPEPRPELLRKFIGPPIYDSLISICKMAPDQAEQTVHYYHDIYTAEGVYENEIYPDILALLTTLKDMGAVLAVATSKPESGTMKILEQYKLAPFFPVISAADESEQQNDKKGLILTALSKIGCTPQDAVMIGDTKYDAEGSRLAGTNFVGVLYGFGTKAEMEQEGAALFAKTAGELLSKLTSD